MEAMKNTGPAKEGKTRGREGRKKGGLIEEKD